MGFLDVSADQIQFSLFEIVALLGIGQSIYISIYLLFRSGRMSRGGLPLAYFLNMSAFFVFCFFEYRFADFIAPYAVVKWVLWTLQAPLCCLLIVQVAQIYKVPSFKQFWVLLVVPLAYGAAYFSEKHVQFCRDQPCLDFESWMSFFGVIASIISLLSVWFNREIISGLTQERNHKERYWLILSLIAINTASITTMLINTGVEGFENGWDLTVLVYALALVYLAGTSLFRIYPQAVHIAAAAAMKKPQLSVLEVALAEKIEDLVFVQKVYHEPAYSRSDMAKECDVSEAMISKVISSHFGKSFPQLLNFQRVEDAKRMLQQTDVPAKIVAQEVGFNSLASFNRVFKDITGYPPSHFR